MVKLIDFACAVVSLAVIICLVYTVNDTLDIISSVFGSSVSISNLMTAIESGTTDEIMHIGAVVGTSLFLMFGFPVTIFLVSINGLRSK